MIEDMSSNVRLGDLKVRNTSWATTNLEITRSKWWHKTGRMQIFICPTSPDRTRLCFESFVVWKVDPHMFTNMRTELELPSKLSESLQSVWPWSCLKTAVPQEKHQFQRMSHVLCDQLRRPLSEEEPSAFTCSSPTAPRCAISPMVAVMPCWLLRMRKLQTWVLASCSGTSHHLRAPHLFMCHSSG